MSIAIDDDGAPIRLAAFHRCGAELIVGWRDFAGGHWTPQHFDSAGSPIERCPNCGAAIEAGHVSMLPPDEAQILTRARVKVGINVHRRVDVAMPGPRPHEPWADVAAAAQPPKLERRFTLADALSRLGLGPEPIENSPTLERCGLDAGAVRRAIARHSPEPEPEPHGVSGCYTNEK